MYFGKKRRCDSCGKCVWAACVIVTFAENDLGKKRYDDVLGNCARAENVTVTLAENMFGRCALW